MKIEDQLVSLELAQEMKELGFPQESIWYWIYDDFEEKIYELHMAEFWKRVEDEWGACRELKDVKHISAYSCAELINFLPENTWQFGLHNNGVYFFGPYYFYDVKIKKIIDQFEAPKLADGIAKFLIHLVKEEIINLKEL